MVNYKKLIVCVSFVIAMLQKDIDFWEARLRGLKGTPHGEDAIYDVLMYKKGYGVCAAGVSVVQGHYRTLLSVRSQDDRDALSDLWILTLEKVGKNF